MTLQTIELDRVELSDFQTKPVFIQGIMQQYLHRIARPVDAVVNGIVLRLPAGCIVSIIGGGSGGHVGSILNDLEFTGKNGKKYRAQSGTAIRIPHK